jgi:hypothetical protein
MLGKPREVGIGPGIELELIDTLDKRLPLVCVKILLGNVLLTLVGCGRYVICARQIIAPERYDTCLLWQLPCAVTMIQGRQQLACRQIACSAKDDQIKWINRNQCCLPLVVFVRSECNYLVILHILKYIFYFPIHT